MSMLPRYLSLLITLFTLPIATAEPLTATALHPTQEIPFSRNSSQGKPPGDTYLTLPRSLELGSAAYVLPVPEAWKQTLAKLHPERRDNPLPIFFAGEMTFPGGKTALVVAQLAITAKGDGISRPAPVIECLLYTLDPNSDPAVLFWKGSHTLGTLQSSRIHRGTIDPASAKQAFTLQITGPDTKLKDQPDTLRIHTAEGFQLTLTKP